MTSEMPVCHRNDFKQHFHTCIFMHGIYLLLKNASVPQRTIEVNHQKKKKILKEMIMPKKYTFLCLIYTVQAIFTQKIACKFQK